MRVFYVEPANVDEMEERCYAKWVVAKTPEHAVELWAAFVRTEYLTTWKHTADDDEFFPKDVFLFEPPVPTIPTIVKPEPLFRTAR